VVSVPAFEEAVASIADDPPDAAIVNLTPCGLPWRELKAACQRHEPPIPVLFESCVFRSPDEAGLGRLDASAAFLTKPYPLSQLRREIDRLLLAAAGDEQPPFRSAAARPAAKS